MTLPCRLILSTVALCVAVPALAEQRAFTIVKQGSGMPQVSAATVDAIGAGYLRDMLGQDYNVVETLPVPDGEVPVPHPDDDPTPVDCYCPEEFGVDLLDRWSQVAQGRGLDVMTLTPNLAEPPQSVLDRLTAPQARELIGIGQRQGLMGQ